MSVEIPTMPREINTIILEFSQMDLLPSEQILRNFLDLDVFSDYPLNDFFDQGGFSSSLSLLNLGSTFIYLILVLPLLLITLIVFYLPSCKPNSLLYRLREWYLKKFFVAYFIRLIIEEYLMIAVCVAINMNSIGFDKGVELGSTITSIILIAVGIVMFTGFVIYVVV